VLELQRRFNVESAQAERVARVAARLFLGAVPRADADTRRELRWACALHEIGMMVSHHDHHRHSAYLLAHVDAAGFSQSQLRRIADLVLGQRGGLRKIDALLADDDYAWQVLCLRLGVIHCHARGATGDADIGLRRDGDKARLAFAPGWSEDHPSTLHLLREEAEAWAKSGRLELSLGSMG
jgi:exopolyphosphatase/guanosine-5'-triphosphate,3'-diphosphate pyrophosphatase